MRTTSIIDDYLMTNIDAFNREEILLYLSFNHFTKDTKKTVTHADFEKVILNKMSIFDSTNKERDISHYKEKLDVAIERLKAKVLLIEVDNAFIFTKTSPFGDFVEMPELFFENLSEFDMSRSEIVFVLDKIFTKQYQNNAYFAASELAFETAENVDFVDKLIEKCIIFNYPENNVERFKFYIE